MVLRKHRTVRGLVCAAFAVSCLACSNSDAEVAESESSVYFPSASWRTSTPEQQGMDSAILASALDTLARQSEYRIHSLLVLRHGYVVTDAYFNPYAGEPHDVASVTKSVTSTLVGTALQRGLLQGLDQSIADVISVPDDKAAIAVEHLLTMRSGIECIADPVELTLGLMERTPDWIEYVLALPVAAAPGTEWVYCSPGVHLLAKVLESAVGQPLSGFAAQSLFEPLGIREAGWPLDPQGLVHGWGDLRLTPQDMARIVYLYLNDGVWAGRRLLPEGWVNDLRRNVRADSYGYGYLWWLPEASYYAAEGRGGQFILVVPNEELVVVLTGGGGGPNPKALLSELILPAIRSDRPLTRNAAGEVALENALDAIGQPPRFEPQPAVPTPAQAVGISGRTIRLDPNDVGVLTLRASFDTPDQMSLHLTTTGWLAGDDDFTWVAGLDGVPRVAPGRFDLPASASGRWSPDGSLELEVDEVANNNRWAVRMTIADGIVTLQLGGILGNVTIAGSVPQ